MPYVSSFFTALFWNVWAQNQISTARQRMLLARLDDIIATHNPDVLGLNEVLADKNNRSAILDHLQKQGYQTYFAPFSPENRDHFSGSALASRIPPDTINYHDLGPDKYGAIRGFPGHTIKLIQAKVPYGSRHVNVVVNHLAHLVPWNWPAHLTHHKAFRKLMRAPELQSTTIIGGDFNQFKFMPRMWGAKSLYHRATGTILNPTWKLIGKIPIIQANYDNVFWTKCNTISLHEFKILDRHPSDHTPLITKFIVK